MENTKKNKRTVFIQAKRDVFVLFFAAQIELTEIKSHISYPSWDKSREQTHKLSQMQRHQCLTSLARIILLVVQPHVHFLYGIPRFRYMASSNTRKYLKL